MDMNEILYVVDTSNWLYKFSAIFNRKITLHGVEVDTSTLFGLSRVIRTTSFKNMLFVFDATPMVSDNLLQVYKSQRDKEETSCRVPIDVIIRFIYSVGKFYRKNVMVCVSPGHEADQVISSVAHVISGKAPANYEFLSSLYKDAHPLESDSRAKPFIGGEELEVDFSQYKRCIIGTTDSDMYQLTAYPNVFIDGSTNGSKIDYSGRAPKAVHNLPVGCIPAYKMILGDISDNVPPLSLTTKKAVVMNLIEKYLNTIGKCESFLKMALRRDFKGLPPDLASLGSEIVQSVQVDKMSINYKVTALKFYSLPYVMTYPDFSLNSVVSKYRIRL